MSADTRYGRTSSTAPTKETAPERDISSISRGDERVALVVLEGSDMDEIGPCRQDPRQRRGSPDSPSRGPGG